MTDRGPLRQEGEGYADISCAAQRPWNRLPRCVPKPGCGNTFDLRITAKEAGMLAGAIACPRCRRHGGMLKPAGRLGDKVFSAKLAFKLTGVGPTLPDEEGDLLSDIS
jgi:hypothetical protein